MNRIPDRDSPSQTASDLIHVLVPRYFDPGRVHVLVDRNSDTRMKSIANSARAKLASFTQLELSTSADAPDKHNPDGLARGIGYVYFKDHLDSNCYLFDYDDTIVGRENRYPRSSSSNVGAIWRLNELTTVGICTGNTISAIDLRSRSATPPASLRVYADGGLNEYLYRIVPSEIVGPSYLEPERCLAPEVQLEAVGPRSAAEIITKLQKAGISTDKVQTRGNALVAIKPIAHELRPTLIKRLQEMFSIDILEVRAVGRTTVEICKPQLSKLYAIRDVLARNSSLQGITYVGDEFESGNDHDIGKFAALEPAVKCLHVSGPAETAFFLTTLFGHLTEDV